MAVGKRKCRLSEDDVVALSIERADASLQLLKSNAGKGNVGFTVPQYHPRKKDYTVEDIDKVI